MRIALVGYGKMGKMIEEVALQRGHHITAKIDEENKQDLNDVTAKEIDVAIEFTSPHSAFVNVLKCLDLQLPVVSGSTGWNSDVIKASAHCLQNGGAFLHSSNFSIGVNIFFQVNKLLARLMNQQPEYDIALKEIHHTQKKDAPSGTAVTLAEQVLHEVERKDAWVNRVSQNSHELSISSERIDPAPGTHYVKYSSDIDDIEIIHTAHSRKGFALGAVLAAEFINGKQGVFTMTDVLHL